MVIGGFFSIQIIMLSWGEDFCKKGIKNYTMMWLQLFMVGVLGFAGFFNSFLIYLSFTWVSKKMHAKMVFRVLHAKVIEFLQRIPMGRFLNRFSNDIDAIDNKYGNFIVGVTIFFFLTVMNFFVFFFSTKSFWLIIPGIVYSVVGYYYRNLYMKVKREMVRLFAISKTPIVGLGTSTILGGPVIRSIGNQEYFREKIDFYVEENTKNGIMYIGLDSWFKVQLTLYNFFLVMLPCYGLLLYSLQTGDDKDKSNSTIALFMLRVVEFAQDYGAFLAEVSSAETLLISAERCKAFEEIEPEEDYKNFEEDRKIFENPHKKLKKEKEVIRNRKHEEIFENGEIEMSHVVALYPTSTKPVLKDLSLKIKSGERIGIVGRTGAGKSSFIKLIWRALHPSEGEIFVSGQDISKLDLKLFRDQITVISQKPSLFEGPIWENISPVQFNKETENEIINTLISLGFSESKLETKGLNFQLDADGSNLSQGEKQILALVRAIHNKRKIVILDEATAYIDKECERKFQEKLNTSFEGCTMIVIAHRVKSVLDCDRIFVFDSGEIVERGKVGELMKNEDSIFAGIMSKM